MPEVDRAAEAREGADLAIQKIFTAFDRLDGRDPADGDAVKRLEAEELQIVLDCPHCSEILRGRWKDPAYVALVKRNGPIGASNRGPSQISIGARDRRGNEHPEPLTLVSDPGITVSGFEQWHSALMNTSVDEGDYFKMPFEDVCFRQLPPSVGNELRLDFWLGESSSAAVQINEPSVPGTESPLGGLAVDAAGSPAADRR